MNLAGLSLRYLIGVDETPAGNSDSITEVPLDSGPALTGISIGYTNLRREDGEPEGYGPYLPHDDIWEQYKEGRPDPSGPGYERNIVEQLDRRVAQGFQYIEQDNPDSYQLDAVLKAVAWAEGRKLAVIAKNPLLMKDGATQYLAHPNVVAAIVEKDCGSPADMVVLRTAAGKPDMPVWFVSFGDGRAWAEQIAQQIKAAHYVNIGVTFSSQGEYENSEDILAPLSAADHPIMTIPSPVPTGAFPYGPTIKKVMLARGYPWFPDQNVVTVETMNDDGSLCLTGANTFDDQKMVLDGDGNVIGGPWDATDHPGAYWTEHPMASGGAFIISLGPQACWAPGEYHGFEVWRQAPDSTIMGTRDPNDTYKRIGPPIAHGDIGVHHHGGYNLSKGDIATAAAGCQVIRLTKSQAAFMALTKQCPRYLADPQGYRLTATVLTAQDVLDAYASPPALTPTPVPLPVPITRPPGIVLDTAVDVTSSLARLQASGVTTVIGYLTTNMSSAKLVRPAEAHAMAAVGMRLALVFEIWGGVNDFIHNDISAATGAAHASFAKGYMPQLGAPNGAGIYFAIDTNCTASQITSFVLPYLRAAKAALGGQYRLGLYGCGAALQAALDEGILDLPTWLTQSTGWNGYHAFLPKAGIVQKMPSSLAGLDVDEDNVIAAVDIGDFVPFAGTLPAPAPLPVPALTPQPTTPLRAGKAGWYSQYSGKYEWVDTGDAPGSNALGVPDNCQGCAFPTRAALGDWFEIHAPNGAISIEQQTDVGPATWTGRGIDISAAAAERFGYSPASFPTNATFYWRPIDPPVAVGGLSVQQQAVKYLALRSLAPIPAPSPAPAPAPPPPPPLPTQPVPLPSPKEPPVVTDPLPLPPPQPTAALTDAQKAQLVDALSPVIAATVQRALQSRTAPLLTKLFNAVPQLSILAYVALNALQAFGQVGTATGGTATTTGVIATSGILGAGALGLLSKLGGLLSLIPKP